MNRTIALFVALVILLAHCLAIHTDGQGHFAFPYDQAYVPLRLAHNLVFEGELRWNPGVSAWESYGSHLWIAIAAVAERICASRIGDHMQISVNVIVQATSVLAALLTVILTAQVRGDRAAGLIAPLLLVTCGCFAAAAANGIETTLFALFVTASFWAFESRLGNRLGLAMTLLCLTRPEGMYVVAGLFLLRFLGFRRGTPRPSIWPFAAPALTVGATAFLRWKATGFYLPPPCFALLHPRDGQLTEGLEWLGDSLRTAISLVLLVYAFVAFSRGRISGMGARALALALILVFATVPAGRGPLPFAEALVPALPLAFIAVQEGMIESLDGPSVLARRLALSSLFSCLFVTALVSRHPADLGPLPLETWHGRWMRSRGSARFGYEQPLGRLGLEEEIDATIRLRGLGVFLRDFLDPGSTVLTPWPGCLGYLSRLRVFDLLGRASPVAGKERPAPCVDVVSALAMHADYVVEGISPRPRAPKLREIARTLLEELDDRAGEGYADAGRLGKIEAELSRYEMVTIPIRLAPRGSAPARNEPFSLLRRRDLAQRPKLRLAIDGREFRVLMSQSSHLQIADLRIEAVDARGRIWTFRPTGELVEGERALARPALLVSSSGTRPIELFRERLPAQADGADLVEIRAVLRNPGADEEDAFADASDEVSGRP